MSYLNTYLVVICICLTGGRAWAFSFGDLLGQIGEGLSSVAPSMEETKAVPIPTPRPDYTPPDIVGAGRISSSFTLRDRNSRTVLNAESLFSSQRRPDLAILGIDRKNSDQIWMSINGKRGMTSMSELLSFDYGVFEGHGIYREPREDESLLIQKTKKDANVPRSSLLYTGTTDGDWYQVLVSDHRTSPIKGELGWVNADGVPPEVQSKIASSPQQMNYVEKEPDCVSKRHELEDNTKIKRGLASKGVDVSHIFSSWRGTGFLTKNVEIKIDESGKYSISKFGSLEKTGYGRICIERGDVFLYAESTDGKEKRIPLSNPNQLTLDTYTFQRMPATSQRTVQ